jgi:hypothetical protein
MKGVNKIGEDTLNVVFAAMSNGLNRYTINTGKIYGNNTGSKRYKILKLSGDTVYYKDLNNQKVEAEDVDKLLAKWYDTGVQEIAFIDEIIEQIRKYLGPLLGPFVMGGLIAWLMGKLK